MRRITTDSGPPWRLACEKCLRPSVSRNCGVNTPVIGSRMAVVFTASRLTATSTFASTRRSRLSMRASTSGASAVLPMKSLAPESRARFLVVSFSSPEITTTGIALMRASPLPRMRDSSPKPSSFGIDRSVNTMTIDLSLSIAIQPASPSASSRTAKFASRMRLKVARTNLESSTSSTVRCGRSAMRSLLRQVDDDAAVDLRVDEVVEDARQLGERYGARHLLQQRRLEVARHPLPHHLADIVRAVAGIDAEQAGAAQDERHYPGVQLGALRQADGADHAVFLHGARHPGERLAAEVVDCARPHRLVEGADSFQIEIL